MSCAQTELVVQLETPFPGKYGSLRLRQFPDAGIEKLWRECLARAACPAHYDSPEFFLEPYWKDERPFAILLLCDGMPVGAITGFDQGKEILSGLCSRPQLCIASDADTGVTSHMLASALLSHFPDAKIFTIHGWGIRELPGLEEWGFRKAVTEGSVLLDLRPGAASILENLPQHRRRDIRKAIQNGIEIREATTGADFDAYWGVYTAWKSTVRKTIRHDREYEALAAVQRMRNNHRRFLAWYKGEAVAASGLRFCRGGLVELANNCSRDEYLRLCPNDLLVWKMIEWACENGFCTLSMGGAHPFVRKWSETVVPVYRYRLDRTLFHRVQLKEDATERAKQLIHRLPSPVQAVLKTILRRPA